MGASEVPEYIFAHFEKHWRDACTYMRSSGEDPEALLEKAAENIRKWRALSKREQDQRRRVSDDEWAALESIVNDIGAIDAEAKQTLAMFCEHANECPVTCPCEPGCYCKSHTCKGK